MRSRIVMAAVAAGVNLLAAGCGSSDPGGRPAAGTSNPAADQVKVGLVAPSTGVLGLYGPTLEGVMRKALSQAGVAEGLELLREDDAGDPQQALTKVRKLVQEDDADVVICCVNGAATLAVAPYLQSVGIPQIAPIPGPAGLGQFDTAYSVGFYPQQLTKPFGAYAYEELGHRKAIVLSSDFVQGHDVANGFIEGFEAAGGEIVKEIYPPLDTSDYGPYLSQVSDADVVFGFFAGADAVRLVKQYDAAGLKDKAQLIGLGPIVSRLVLDQIGEAAVGVQGVFHYAESGMGNDADDAFVTAVSTVAPPEVTPNFVQANAWSTIEVISRAVEASRSSGSSLLESIAAIEIDAPWGPLSFNSETHYPVLEGLVYEVVEGPERLDHEIVGTFEGSQ